MLDRVVVATLDEGDSLRRRAGHQLLGRSEGATDDEAHALMPLGDGAEAGEVRHLFQRLAGGRYVVGCVRGLAKRDWVGRKGVSFGQFWLIDAESFGLLGNDPFRVLRRVPFYEGMEEALKERGATLGHRLPALLCQPEEFQSFDVPTPSADEIRACLGAALRRDEVLFIGSDDATFTHLASVFGAIPPELRAGLSFVHGTLKPTGPYWARCYPRRPRNAYPVEVEVGQEVRVVQKPVAGASLFESWLAASTRNRPPEEVARDAPLALARLAGQKVGPHTLEGLGDPLRSELETLLRPEFQREFLDRLANSLGRQLADFLRAKYLPKDDDPVERLFETPSLREVAASLVDRFETEELKLQSWYEPLSYANILGESRVLELLVMTESVLRDPTSDQTFKRLRRAAAEADRDDLRRYVLWLARRVPIGVQVYQSAQLLQLGVTFSFEPDPGEGRVGAGRVLYALLDAISDADDGAPQPSRYMDDPRNVRRVWMIEELLVHARRAGFNA